MPDMTLESSYDGGDDGYDSTGRVKVSSYQRGTSPAGDRYGEILRIDLARSDAKGAIAWRFPSEGYDEDRNPVGEMVTAVWLVAHWEKNDHTGNHKHVSFEVPDASGQLQTRFSIEFGDINDDDGIGGRDRTLIMTDSADFVVRCGGNVLRLAASAGLAKEIEFSNDARGAPTARRWKIRANTSAETGNNAGTDLTFSRHDDGGVALDSPVTVKRSNGRVTLLHGLEGPLRLANVTAAPTTGPAMYVEGGALKFIGSNGTVTTIASA